MDKSAYSGKATNSSPSSATRRIALLFTPTRHKTNKLNHVNKKINSFFGIVHIVFTNLYFGNATVYIPLTN